MYSMIKLSAETKYLCSASMMLTIKRSIKLALYAIAPGFSSRVALRKVRINQRINNTARRLEIGPGIHIIDGYERLNIYQDGYSEFVGDAISMKFFTDNEYDEIYASHVLEHIPWFEADRALMNWFRILKPKGYLDIWVPDAYKIAKAYVLSKEENCKDFLLDGWFKYNPDQDPSIWFNGRIFSYGDGTANPKSPNWHRAAYDEQSLTRLMTKAGFNNIVKLHKNDIKGYDHGWINLGMRGYKV